MDHRDLAAVLEIARQKLETGDLPDAPSHAYAGYEQQALRCSLCDTEIEARDIGYDVNVIHQGAKTTLNFHRSCYEVWAMESERRARSRKPT